MSGGSMEYLYYKVQDVAKELCNSTNPLRRAFSKQLFLTAKALRSIEWNDSDDGDDNEPDNIKAVLGQHWKEMTLNSTLEQIEKIKQELILLCSEDTAERE